MEEETIEVPYDNELIGKTEAIQVFDDLSFGSFTFYEWESIYREFDERGIIVSTLN